MPELPEVETLCRDMRAWDIFNVPMRKIQVMWPRTIEPLSEKLFSDKLLHTRIAQIDRHGKYIDMHLDTNYHLFTHLRMTGCYRFVSRDYKAEPYDRVIFIFESGCLVYSDPRKFGRITLVEHEHDITDTLGFDPFDSKLTAEKLYALCSARSMRIKSLLLSQKVVAGLGNIYTDESLFDAGVHPCRIASSLTEAEIGNLLGSIRSKLQMGIIHRGTSLGDGVGNFRSNGYVGSNIQNLKVYQKDGTACPRCGTTIERIIVGQRSTHLCPSCQKLQ